MWTVLCLAPVTLFQCELLQVPVVGDKCTPMHLWSDVLKYIRLEYKVLLYNISPKS